MPNVYIGEENVVRQLDIYKEFYYLFHSVGTSIKCIEYFFNLYKFYQNPSCEQAIHILAKIAEVSVYNNFNNLKFTKAEFEDNLAAYLAMAIINTVIIRSICFLKFDDANKITKDPFDDPRFWNEIYNWVSLTQIQLFDENNKYYAVFSSGVAMVTTVATAYLDIASYFEHKAVDESPTPETTDHKIDFAGNLAAPQEEL